MTESTHSDERPAPDDSGTVRASDEARPRHGLLRKRSSWVLAFLVLAALATLTWRRFTQNDTNAARQASQAARDENSKLQRPIDPFTFGPFSLRPSETDRIESGIKPGHWTLASAECRANFADFRGDLATEMVTPLGGAVMLDDLPFGLRSSRPALLAKMQKKLLDIAVFTPVDSRERQIALRLQSPSGREAWTARELLTFVPGDQFFFVALVQSPDDYRFLHTLDSLWAPRGSLNDRGLQAHYRVLLPAITTTVPVPNRALYWTNTAVVLWDSLDPRLLNSEQQEAFVDWLHWGGQLIVSGPDSLDLLRGSFLDPWLPAAPGANWDLNEETLQSLGQLSPDLSRKLRVAHSWTGQHLDLQGRDAHVLAQAPGQDALIAERQIGRGRAVVTAFRLTQRELVDWPGYDGLFNAVLLRRPPRRFVNGYEDRIGVSWADGVLEDSARISQVRIFTRDAGRAAISPPAADQMPWVKGLPSRVSATSGVNVTSPPDPADRQSVDAGVAAWDDQSLASKAARDSLKEAARIEVPHASFVLKMLGIYALVLVPLNWLLFRWLGRVEIAWLAAPFIAGTFAVAVVRLAQLNIGFDRSATDISVLEIHAGYPRGHLTRYGLLYTSLATDYSLAFDNPTAVVLPFASGSGISSQQSRGLVTFRQEPAATGTAEIPPIQLMNLSVPSNATGMLHSEEMVALSGAVRFARGDQSNSYKILNETGLHLRNAMIVSASKEVNLGTLPPDAEVQFSFESNGTTNEAQPSASLPASSPDDAADSLSLHNLLRLAKHENPAREIRLVAWTDEPFPGLSVTPAATEARHATMIVAHLHFGPVRPVEIDFNSRAQVAKAVQDDLQGIDSPPTPAENEP